MKSFPLFLAALAALAIARPVSAQESKGVLPVAPKALLNVLPTTAEGWKLTQSHAETTFDYWLQTSAQRIYQPLPSPTGEKVEGEVEVRVVDTGRFAQSLAIFDGFKPEKQGDLEKFLLAGYPAIRSIIPPNQRFVQVLLAGRFIAEVVITDLPKVEAETWIKALRFEGLDLKDSRPVAVLPNPVRLEFYDELNPAKNRSYEVGRTTPETVANAQKYVPKEPVPSPTPAR